MANIDLREAVASTLIDIDAGAIAGGAAVGDTTEIASRGRYAGTDAGAHSLFYGASITKQMLGVLLARAAVSGALDPSDLISRWLPELSDHTGSVRVEHLIHHTSGLPDVMEFSDGDPRSNAEVIERFRHSSPVANARPGTRFAYNNAGWVLLTEALSRSLDQPVSELASAVLFAPLNLSGARLGGTPIEIPGSPDPPGTIGDGGLWISVVDLLGWLRACNAQAFGADVHRLAETTTHLADGSPLNYAWGVRITPALVGRIISHGGSWATWQSKTVRIPERQIAVAILSVGATAEQVSDAATGLAVALADDG